MAFFHFFGDVMRQNEDCQGGILGGVAFFKRKIAKVEECHAGILPKNGLVMGFFKEECHLNHHGKAMVKDVPFLRSIFLTYFFWTNRAISL